jgi:hypothetical protein
MCKEYELANANNCKDWWLVNLFFKWYTYIHK